MHNGNRHLRIVVLRLLFLIGFLVNVLLLARVRIIERPLDEKTLSGLSYGAVAVNRFVPVAIFENYRAESIVISQEAMSQLQLETRDLQHFARVDRVQIISQYEGEKLEPPISEAVRERVEYMLGAEMSVVFLLPPDGTNVVTVGTRHEEGVIIFFPLVTEEGR